MGAFKDKILDELYNNNYRELYDIIDQMESDVDVANYISSGKGYYPKMMSTKDLEGMPEFRKALYSELKTGEVDLDKEFGSDWYKNYEQIPSDQIKFVADKQGVSYGKLVKEMGEQATKKRRYDIAHDGTLSGYITEFAAPRSIEAIERGESPSPTDAVLDVGQNIAYAAPWARISAPLARLGLAGRFAQGTVGNMLTPTIMEGADAALYDDTNPRGNFKLSDVATETAVNATTPWLIRGALTGIGRFTTGKGRELANKFMELGTSRQTKEDVINSFTKKSLETSPQSIAKAAAKDISSGTADNLAPNEISAGLAYLKDPNYKAEYDRLYAKLAYKTSKFKDKLSGNKQFKVGDATITFDEAKLPFTDKELEFIIKDPNLVKLLPASINKLPSNRQLRMEEAAKNYLTNQAGTYWYDEQSPYTRIPIFGTRIDKYYKDQEKEEENKVKESIILEALKAKYGTPRGL